MAEGKGGRGRSEAARQSILGATRSVLAELGYDRLTIERVAADAGVGKQTIYRWWASKSALVAECVADSAATMTVDVPVPDTGDIRADIEAWLIVMIGFSSDPPAVAQMRGLISAAADSPAMADRMYSQVTSSAEHALARRLSASVNVDASRPARSAAVAILGAFIYGILINRPLDASAAHDLAELIARGLTD